MAVGLFVPYAAYDLGSVNDHVSIIDFEDLRYFYVGLGVLVGSVAASCSRDHSRVTALENTLQNGAF
jgi:hypothetical protein